MINTSHLKFRRPLCWLLALVLTLSSVTSAAFMGVHGPGSAAGHAESVDHSSQGKSVPCESHGEAGSSPYVGHIGLETQEEPDARSGSAAHGHCSDCVLCSATVFALDGLNDFQGTLLVDNSIEPSPVLTAAFHRLDKPPKS